MTDIELLKTYMSPYYQSTEDEALLEMYLETHKTAEASASVLWSVSATKIWAGNIKSFGTGAESTSFQTLYNVIKFCSSQAEAFAKLDANKRRIGSMMGTVKPVRFAGGATDE